MEFNFDRSKSARQILISTLLSRRGQRRTQKTRQLKALDVHSPKTISFFIHVNRIYVSHVAMQNANREASGLMRRDKKMSKWHPRTAHSISMCIVFNLKLQSFSSVRWLGGVFLMSFIDFVSTTNSRLRYMFSNSFVFIPLCDTLLFGIA